jgi:hypothetical protein
MILWGRSLTPSPMNIRHTYSVLSSPLKYYTHIIDTIHWNKTLLVFCDLLHNTYSKIRCYSNMKFHNNSDKGHSCIILQTHTYTLVCMCIIFHNWVKGKLSM